MLRPNRREILQASIATVLLGGTSQLAWGLAPREKLPVAAVVTEYRSGSHTDVIVGKILEGWQQDGGPGPDLRLASLYTDQVPNSDLSRKLAAKHGFRLAKTIDEAVTLGTDQVQVAGVLSIGEHGDYPATPDTKQVKYPRRRFFDEIVAAFRRCGTVVPVFSDKHLAYRWDDALHMVGTARELMFPLLAGSSAPVAWRKPLLDLPRDCEIEAALTVGYGGFEAYGFHALECHQCMIERRRGGETGVAAVQAVSGEEIGRSAANGLWSKELLAAVLKTLPKPREDTGKWMTADSAAYLIEHRDGFRSAVLMANGLANQFAFAAKLQGQHEPIAVWFKLQEHAPYGHFAYLLRAIEHTIHSHAAAYPVERTLLTTGVLDRVMQSLYQQGKRLETPELDIAYKSVDWPYANRPDSPLILPSD